MSTPGPKHHPGTFTNELRKRLQRGNFPYLKKFLVITTRSSLVGPDCIIVRDICAETIKHHFYLDKGILVPSDERYQYSDQDGNETSQSKDGLLALIEDNANWTTSHYSSRLPARVDTHKEDADSRGHALGN